MVKINEKCTMWGILDLSLVDGLRLVLCRKIASIPLSGVRVFVDFVKKSLHFSCLKPSFSSCEIANIKNMKVVSLRLRKSPEPDVFMAQRICFVPRAMDWQVEVTHG